MRYVLVAVCLVAAFVSGAWAQEGHPLEGFWHGEIGTGASKKPVTLLMKWENRMIRGFLNPGLNQAPLKIATLEPKGWKLHLEAETKDEKGNLVPVTIDAQIEDIGKYRRKLVGTYTQGAVKSEFRATRD